MAAWFIEDNGANITLYQTLATIHTFEFGFGYNEP